MANVVLLLGSTGTGKSHSIKTLDPKETYVINVCKKPLPFRGSKSIYSAQNKNFLEAGPHICQPDEDGNYTLSFATVLQVLDGINANRPDIHTIVIDDAMYMLKYMYIDLSKQQGYNKYTEFTVHFKRLLLKCQSLRDDLTIYLNVHPVAVETEGRIVTYEVAIPGKMINATINPMENTTILLYARPRFDINGKPEYGFYTNTRMMDGIVIPAKTPEGMFEDDFIPNDLAYVNEKINNYLYTEENETTE